MTVEYSQDELCEHIASGKSLISWCKKSGVGYSTITAHLAKDLDFQAKYARAREDQADYLADEIIEIADSEPDSARARVRTDVRKWAASKMKPKKYGESIKHTGDASEPIHQKHSLEVAFVTNADRDTTGV